MQRLPGRSLKYVYNMNKLPLPNTGIHGIVNTTGDEPVRMKGAVVYEIPV